MGDFQQKVRRTEVVWIYKERRKEDSAWTGALEGTVKEGGSQRKVRKTFEILREV